MTTLDFLNTKEINVGYLSVTGGMQRTGQVYNVPAKQGGIGDTSGWTKIGNNGAVLCPAGQTAATWTLPLHFKNGTQITAFTVSGQIESGGNVVTLDADLRYTTAAAADLVDTSVGAITQISKTADYLIADAKTGLSHTVGAGESYYVLFTATTAAATDIALQGVEVQVTEQ